MMGLSLQKNSPAGLGSGFFWRHSPMSSDRSLLLAGFIPEKWPYFVVLFSRSLHSAMVVGTGRRESVRAHAHYHPLWQPPSFFFAFPFRSFAYVLMVSMCVSASVCFMCSFFDSLSSVSLFHPTQFYWFHFYLIVSKGGQQRPNPIHLPFGIILRTTAFLGC